MSVLRGRLAPLDWIRWGFFGLFAVFGAWTLERNAGWWREVAIWEDALSKSPHKARVHGNLGVAYYLRGKAAPDAERRLSDWDQAERRFRAAVTIEPGFTEIWANLGNLLYEERRLDEAEEAFDHALRLSPQRGEFHANLGGIYMSRGWMEEAILEISAAKQLTPHPSRACSNLGVAFAAQKRYAEAVTVLEEAVKIDPDYTEAWVNLGLAYRNAGRSEEAERTLAAVCVARPGNVPAALNLALLRWEEHHDREMALKLVDQALRAMGPHDDRRADAERFRQEVLDGGGG